MIPQPSQICIYLECSDGKIYAYASDGISDGPVLVGEQARQAIARAATDFGLDPEDILENDFHSRLTTFAGVPLEE